MTDKPYEKRRIRSFVRREGRMTEGQRHNLDTLWPKYGLALPEQPYNWTEVFGRDAPRTLEIGFGAGEVLTDLVTRTPDEDFIGIEVYRNGVGRLLGILDAHGANNVRLCCDDAVEILARGVKDACIDNVLLYFPDPWPKKRHHKRRIVSTEFAHSIARVLKPGGVWRLATDWQNYAQWMRDVLDPHPLFNNIGDQNGYVSEPPRCSTRFEARGLRKGHEVFDLAYQRI